MSKIKLYFKDYAEAQKACNEFNKKHWLGNLILTFVITVGTYFGLGLYEKYKNKKEEDKILEDDDF